MRFRLFIAAALATGAFAAAPALAQSAAEKSYVVVVPDPEGGARFVSSRAATASSVELALGITADPPPGTTALILEKGKPPRWSTAELSAIDRQLGGDGQVEIELDFAGPSAVQDLEEIPADVPRDLFADASATRVQPADGTWAAKIVSKEMSGCPSMFAGPLMEQVPTGGAENITFSRPFDPNDLSPAASLFKWTPTGPNGWVSTIVDVAPEADMSFSNRQALHVVSPDRIRKWTVIELNVPAVVAGLLGGSSECKVEIRALYERTG